MDMYNEENVICVASVYEQKFYINPKFNRLPVSVKEELKIMCALFVEDVGGIVTLQFNDEDELEFATEHAEGDILYDEIGAGLKVKQLRIQKQELLEALEVYKRSLDSIK